MSSADELQQVDRVVIVMGPTGVGKSTFIDFATVQNGDNIGHGLKSCTGAIRHTKLQHPDDDHPTVFVDTPGFDDTYKSDTEILAMIAEWLVKTYKKRIQITSILYLHRITDNRMAGSAAKNLRIFVDMCGQKGMKNVVIVTTMWGEVNVTTGERREAELKKTFWKDLLDNGCQVKRFEDTTESAWEILGSRNNKHAADVLLSKQIVDSRLKLNETDAGIGLVKELDKLLKDRKAAARRLQELVRKQGDRKAMERLKREQEEIAEKIHSTLVQIQSLKIPIKRKFIRLFRS